METNNFIPGFKIDSSLIISITVSKNKCNKLFNLAGFSEENTAEFIAVKSHHSLLGETTNKRKFVIPVLSEEIIIKHLVVIKTNHQNVYFYQFILDKNSQQTTSTVTTQDISRSALDALFVQEFIRLHAIVDEMSNLRCRMNKIFRQVESALMGNGELHSLFIGKEGVVGLLAESAGPITYVHHCAKTIVELTALNYCTKEVPIIVRQNDNQS